MDKFEVVRNIFIVTFVLGGMKSVIGFRFPWETCECCGKKIRDHKKDNKGNSLTPETPTESPETPEHIPDKKKRKTTKKSTKTATESDKPTKKSTKK
jgi:hypothetical protein